MSLNRHAIRFLPLAGLGAALAAVLSGCGGASTSGTPLVATPNSGPVIYGLNALAAITNGAIQGETSALGYTNGAGAVVGVLTGATAYTTDSGAGPLASYKAKIATGIPLGFASDGSFFSTIPGAALPTANASAVSFHAYISTGVQNGNQVDLDTNSVLLTSTEAPSLSQKLTFDPNFGNGQIGQGQYTTGNFALPPALATTGLHNLRASLADVAGQKSHTDFDIVEVGPADVALYAATITADGQAKPAAAAINPGDVGELDNAAGTPVVTAGARQQAKADAQGVIILFAPAGSYVFKTTSADGKTVTKQTIDLSKAAGTAVIQ